MHRKWEELGICCRDNLGAFAGGGFSGGPVQGRGGEAGHRGGGKGRGGGPQARRRSRRNGRSPFACPEGGRPAARMPAAFAEMERGCKKLPGILDTGDGRIKQQH